MDFDVGQCVKHAKWDEDAARAETARDLARLSHAMMT
jgi:hypothetical protein